MFKLFTKNLKTKDENTEPVSPSISEILDDIKMMEATSDPFLSGFKGQTALHRIVQGKEFSVEDRVRAQTLIMAGADVNAKDDDCRSPLHLAGSVAAAEFLIAHRADLNAIDKHGNNTHFRRKPDYDLPWNSRSDGALAERVSYCIMNAIREGHSSTSRQNYNSNLRAWLAIPEWKRLLVEKLGYDEFDVSELPEWLTETVNTIGLTSVDLDSLRALLRYENS